MDRVRAYLGKVVLKDKIISDGAVVLCGDTIAEVGYRADVQLPEHVTDTNGRLIAPGFVDIHCHAGGQFWAHENPGAVAEYHLKHGTTGFLGTLYRDLGHEGTLDALEKISATMKTCRNLLGVHMEGPYLNPEYGAGARKGVYVAANKAEYTEYIKSGIIRQWTFAPEIEGTDEFLEDIKAAGIAPAIGHTEALPERVYEVCSKGVKIITHLTNATGSAVLPKRGIKVMTFDHAALLCDNVYYELICDEKGIHVPHDLIRLIIKTVGVDKIVGITDACTGSEDDSDVNFFNGTLMGSKLTMDKVARNFLSLGLNLCDVFKITSFNPACAIGMDGVMGSIEVGKKANLILTDGRLESVSVV